MHHLVGFYKSVADASVYADLTAANDQSVPTDINGNFLFQSDWKVWAVSVLGNGIDAARHSAPLLRGLFLPEIYPVVRAATVPDSVPICNYHGMGPQLRRNDPYNIQVSQASGGALDVFALAWVGDRIQPAPPGPINKLLCTATPTLVKGQWVNVALTQAQQLPSGRYAVVGMSAQGTAHFGVRLVFPGQNMFRPGCIGQPTYPFYPRDDYFSNGQYGLYGYFDNTAPPTADCFGLAAGANAVKIWLDLVKVG
jgi:hypothetical protein